MKTAKERKRERLIIGQFEAELKRNQFVLDFVPEMLDVLGQAARVIDGDLFPGIRRRIADTIQKVKSVQPSVIVDARGLSRQTDRGVRMSTAEKNRHRKHALHKAEREAENRVEMEWAQAPRHLTFDSPEFKAWRAYMDAMGSRDYVPHPLHKAQEEARAAARAELRAQWAKEDNEPLAELPSHMSREPR